MSGKTHGVYYGKHPHFRKESGQVYEAQASTDHHASIKLVPSVGPPAGLWLCLCGLSLQRLDDAASHPAQLASAHGDLWSLARDLSDRATAVRGPHPSRLVTGPILPGLRLPTHPLARHECLLAPAAADYHSELDDDDQTTVSQPARGRHPLPEFPTLRYVASSRTGMSVLRCSSCSRFSPSMDT